MRNTIHLILLAIWCSSCSDQPGVSHKPDQQITNTTKPPALTGKKIYELMCSLCHGENGDGKGIVVLKTKARSFIDGGYSFGNTQEAVFKTISNGIGGTEMPAFKDSLSEDERWAVTEYVLAFNPDNLIERSGDPVMRVSDKPLIVRGHLPSVSDSAPEHPRGLLVGTTDGLSWEYRADDLRLLAIREGDFVERSDWGGRGGTPLKPLGEVIWLNENGTPAPPWKLITSDGPVELSAKLIGTTIIDGRAIVRVKLENPSGNLVGNVDMWGSSRLENDKLIPIRNFRLVGFDTANLIQYEDLKIEYVPGYPKEFSK